MRFSTYILMATCALATACGSRHGEYTAEYAPFDSVPYHVEVNTAATTSMVKTFPGSYMFRSQYPQYGAVVRYGIVAVDDPARIGKVLTNRFDRMSDNIGIYESDIRSISTDAGFHGWVMVTPECDAPVQMLVTDSATMLVHATMEFTVAPTDTAGVVLPAAQAIAADMGHLIRNLRPE